MKPRLLDLFCGAGGAAMGYYRAGFEIVGVDIESQPDYPFEFVRADALDYPLAGFDAIHASPPCQAYSFALRLGNRGRTDHPRLITGVRERVAGRHYVIENVAGARGELRSPVLLCGSMFGLNIERHRLFECSFPVMAPPCQHGNFGLRRFPGTPREDGSRPESRIVNPMASGCGHEAFAEAMGIDWIPTRGFRPANALREAIPPAYTEHIGFYLMAELKQRVAA